MVAPITPPPPGTRLDVPVPDFLEEALGYTPPADDDRARYIAFWYGPKFTFSDGRCTHCGNGPWWTWKLYREHSSVIFALGPCVNLGSDDGPAEFNLMLDRQERTMWLLPADACARFLREQWEEDLRPTPDVGEAVAPLTGAELSAMVDETMRQWQLRPPADVAEVATRMHRARHLQEMLVDYLDASPQAAAAAKIMAKARTNPDAAVEMLRQRWENPERWDGGQ
jgi:hypothetical protein